MENVTLRRTCVGCRQIKDKRELLRIVKNVKGFLVDYDYVCEGRGAYVCKCEECITAAFGKGGLQRSFKCTIPKEIANQLSKELLEGVKSET